MHSQGPFAVIWLTMRSLFGPTLSCPWYTDAPHMSKRVTPLTISYEMKSVYYTHMFYPQFPHDDVVNWAIYIVPRVNFSVSRIKNRRLLRTIRTLAGFETITSLVGVGVTILHIFKMDGKSMTELMMKLSRSVHFLPRSIHVHNYICNDRPISQTIIVGEFSYTPK
jgi:hypothetical protein